MIFYILMNQITTVFISLHLLTTLSFDSEIESYLYGGSADEMFFQVTNNLKTLALKPKMEGKYSNLLVITKKRKYYFDLKGDSQSPHQFVEIKDGVPSHTVKELIKSPQYEVFESDSSLLFINKKKQEVIVNGKKIKSKDYLSKGVPIIYEGSRILN